MSECFFDKALTNGFDEFRLAFVSWQKCDILLSEYINRCHLFLNLDSVLYESHLSLALFSIFCVFYLSLKWMVFFSNLQTESKLIIVWITIGNEYLWHHWNLPHLQITCSILKVLCYSPYYCISIKWIISPLEKFFTQLFVSTSTVLFFSVVHPRTSTFTGNFQSTHRQRALTIECFIQPEDWVGAQLPQLASLPGC